MDRKQLEELNLRLHAIKNGVDAIKTIDEFITYDAKRRVDIGELGYGNRTALETAKENIMKELMQLEEFKPKLRYY